LPVVLQAQLVGDASLSDTPIAPKQEAHFSKESISPGIPPRPKNHRTGNSFSQARERQNDLPEHCGSWDNDDSSLSSLEFKEFKLVDGVLAPDRISFVFQCAPCQDSTRQNPGGTRDILEDPPARKGSGASRYQWRTLRSASHPPAVRGLFIIGSKRHFDYMIDALRGPRPTLRVSYLT
jgi:hypothetical protein